MARFNKQSLHSRTMPRKVPTRVFLFVILLFSPYLLAEEQLFLRSGVREYVEQEQLVRFDHLFESLGRNKNLPKGFELQTLLALSHYPELDDIKINFIVDDVSIPLSSRPHWSSMLRSARNRTYQVIIDSEREGARGALLLKNQPFNAQVGIIGHELAHTVYYLNRSLFGILGDALCQLSDCRIGFERATDKRLINYGLGWQRFDHARFIRGRIPQNQISASTAEGGGGAYMSPAEILRIIQGHEAYANQTQSSAN